MLSTRHDRGGLGLVSCALNGVSCHTIHWTGGAFTSSVVVDQGRDEGQGKERHQDDYDDGPDRDEQTHPAKTDILTGNSGGTAGRAAFSRGTGLSCATTAITA